MVDLMCIKSTMENRRRRGRPPGKKSNPDFIQVAGYIKKNSYRQLKIKCFELDLEISEALQEMIDRWLKET